VKNLKDTLYIYFLSVVFAPLNFFFKLILEAKLTLDVKNENATYKRKNEEK